MHVEHAEIFGKDSRVKRKPRVKRYSVEACNKSTYSRTEKVSHFAEFSAISPQPALSWIGRLNKVKSDVNVWRAYRELYCITANMFFWDSPRKQSTLTDPMTAAAPSSVQQRPSSPIHDLNTYEQEFLLSPEGEQDLDGIAQSANLDLPVRVTARIRWIHFILGAAVLLPWNGKG